MKSLIFSVVSTIGLFAFSAYSAEWHCGQYRTGRSELFNRPYSLYFQSDKFSGYIIPLNEKVADLLSATEDKAPLCLKGTIRKYRTLSDIYVYDAEVR